MTRDAAAPPLAGRILAGLIVVLPFEPRRPVLPCFGLELTFLEAVAAATTVWLAWAVRGRLRSVLRRPPLPVACLGAFAAAHFVSAAGATAHRGAAAVYSLRMAAAAALAAIVSACDWRDVRRALRAVVPMAGVVAGLALLEGAGLRALDPFLNLFRAGPYVFEGSRRASAATESPNLAAALLAYGLVAAAGLGASAARPLLRSALVGVPLSAGLLLTYSRGGLVAALVGSAVVFAASPRTARSAPLGVLASLLGVAALFATGDGALRRRLLGDWVAAADGARYEPLDAVLVLAAGETRPVRVRVVNSGTTTWLPRAHRLGCAWFAEGRFFDAACEAKLPGPVAPGESVALTALARAPDRAGSYFLVWNVVDELGPFSFQGIPPGLVAAAVGGAGRVALPSNPPSVVSPRSRSRLWRLAWDMWRERPLLGFGPDNFRKLHAVFGGWPSGRGGPVDYAHSAYLEAAASTGTLGLVTLLATLVAALAWGLRALAHATGSEERGAAAALLGLVVVVITHATVDFLLAFTAQYAFFGFVIGAVSALVRSQSLSEPTAAA